MHVQLFLIVVYLRWIHGFALDKEVVEYGKDESYENGLKIWQILEGMESIIGRKQDYKYVQPEKRKYYNNDSSSDWCLYGFSFF